MSGWPGDRLLRHKARLGLDLETDQSASASGGDVKRRLHVTAAAPSVDWARDTDIT